MVGAVGRWPGACDGDGARSQLQRACGDALGAVPATRWSLEAVVNVRVLSDGETVSVNGTHLGHNLPDSRGNRYCINILCVAGHAPTQRR